LLGFLIYAQRVYGMVKNKTPPAYLKTILNKNAKKPKIGGPTPPPPPPGNFSVLKRSKHACNWVLINI
jgi:hypothetical protein